MIDQNTHTQFEPHVGYSYIYMAYKRECVVISALSCVCVCVIQCRFYVEKKGRFVEQASACGCVLESITLNVSLVGVIVVYRIESSMIAA